MDPSISGRGAEPVYRDRIKGKEESFFLKKKEKKRKEIIIIIIMSCLTQYHSSMLQENVYQRKNSSNQGRK